MTCDCARFVIGLETKAKLRSISNAGPNDQSGPRAIHTRACLIQNAACRSHIRRVPGDVRFGSLADIGARPHHVRLTPESGRQASDLG